MIDDSNRVEVLEKLDSIVWSYYIQIASLDALIKIAENIDKIQIIEENDEGPSVNEKKSEKELTEEEIQELIEKSRTQNLTYGEMLKLRKYISTKNAEDREKVLEQFPDHLKKQIESYDKKMEELFSKMAPTFKDIAEAIQMMFERISRVVKPVISKINETKQKVLMRSLLIYAISIWESFLREYLRVILFYNWEVLLRVKKDDEYKIAYGELLKRLQEYDKIEDFRLELIDEYLYKLFHKSIDEISDELERLKLIKLNKFPEWSKLREAYYRRNIITHNNGIINKVYCKKVGIEDCKIGNEIEVSPEYLRKISNIISDFIEYVHGTICEKYKLKLT